MTPTQRDALLAAVRRAAAKRTDADSVFASATAEALLAIEAHLDRIACLMATGRDTSDARTISEFFAAVHDGPPPQSDEFLGESAPAAPAPAKTARSRKVVQ